MIVETLHCEIVIVSGSQLMSPMLCQLVSYPPFEQEDELGVS